MDITQPITQATALSSFPIAKEARVAKTTSNNSISTGRSSTRTSSLSAFESSKKQLPENCIPLERSATYSLEERRVDAVDYDHTVRKYKSSDLLKLETDRESVIQLAQFLRTTDPPPSNYMSLPDDSHRQTQVKKLPFKVLRRQSSKKTSDSVIRTLRLPDSAVAARTSKGHWHIAISIPVEHDYRESKTPSPSQITKHSKAQSESVVRNQPITVLKPEIGNVRPAAIDRGHIKSQSHDDLRQSLASLQPLSVSLLQAAEAEPTSPTPYDQIVIQDASRTTNTEDVRSSHMSSSDSTSFPDAARPDSQPSDARRSIETVSTVQSVTSRTYHTRGESSISTAPSDNYPASPRAIWPHRRHTSGSKHVLDQTEQSIAAHLPLSLLDHRVDNSNRPTSVASDMSSANFKMAATARGYGPDMPGTQVIFVRRGTQTPSYRARIARRTSKISGAEYILSSQSIISSEYSPDTPNGTEVGSITKSRQSRRERVKAIRSRDMAKVRAMKKYHQVMAYVTDQDISSTPASSSNGNRPESYRSHGQRRSLSYASIAEEMAGHGIPNTLTSIVVVADVEPSETSSDISIQPTMHVSNFTPPKSPSDLSVPASYSLMKRRSENDETMSPRKSPDEAHTPPHSVPSSPTSIDEEHMTTNGSAHETYTPPQSISTLSASSDTGSVIFLKPRPTTTINSNAERQTTVARNRLDLGQQTSMSDKTIALRMQRLENINSIIFRTLNAVVEMGMGFRELRHLLPAEPSRPDETLRLKESHYCDYEDQDPVGSLIQELRGAVRIGQEELAKYGAAV